ncbi:hypothetical protein GP5015_471 [gamma proteobacterium HTCC5015]|nr:hypothetical protein GP5015_471 [gamma proteobacterium HTCC5015]
MSFLGILPMAFLAHNLAYLGYDDAAYVLLMTSFICMALSVILQFLPAAWTGMSVGKVDDGD